MSAECRRAAVRSRASNRSGPQPSLARALLVSWITASSASVALPAAVVGDADAGERVLVIRLGFAVAPCTGLSEGTESGVLGADLLLVEGALPLPCPVAGDSPMEMFPVGSASSTRSAANPALVASAPKATAANTARPVRPVRRVLLRAASGEPFTSRGHCPQDDRPADGLVNKPFGVRRCTLNHQSGASQAICPLR